MSVYVGLDMSLTGTGVCVRHEKEGIAPAMESLTIKTTPRTCENDLSRLTYIVDKAMESIPEDVDMVCIEDYFIPQSKMQFNAALKLCALGTLMRVRLLEAGIPFFVISPTQLKKYCLGKGNAKKNLVLMGVLKKWGHEAKDDNQADAYVLSQIAEALMLTPEQMTDMLKYEVEVLDKIWEDRPRYNVKESEES